MAHNVATFPVPIERVFSVLSNPESYAHWVVGADAIRDADAGWPQVGTRLHHRVGVGPLKLNDNTEVVSLSAPTRLVLHARARPFGTARVDLELHDLGDSTRVTMVEEPDDRFSRLLHNPITDRILHKRNAEALRRLGELATG